MKIYTKTGDDGSTGLIGGDRVPKSDPRIECTGTVDELNASLGWAAVTAPSELSARLISIQHELLILGATLAAPAGPAPVALEESSIARLEMEIDAAETELEPLSNFILPGGCETSARLHLARTICRRAERLLVGFSHDRPLTPLIVTYINRLSDWLFVQARWANRQAKVPDILWQR